MSDLSINGKTYSLDGLKLGEIEAIEKAFATGYDKLTTGQQTIGAVWAIVRRDNPDYTLDEARELDVSVLSPPEVKTPKAPRASGS